MSGKAGLPEAHSSRVEGGMLSTLGWAAFLGTSWTWVIGMVLPALLIRDMGMAGFLAFAIPNCVGAAAMGTVLSRGGARSLMKNHRGMVMTFSLVTVAYHFYIAGFLLPTLLGWLALLFFVVGGTLALGAVFLWKDKGAMAFSALVWVISIACFLFAMLSPEAEAFRIYKDRPLLDASYTWFFLPASISGFLLCPYLDATFIRARAKTRGRNGVWAFAIGFLIVFAAMIIFTTAYGHNLLEVFAGEHNRLSGIWWTILVVHLPLQMGLTVAWHTREIFAVITERNQDQPYQAGSRRTMGEMIKIAICSLLFIIVFLTGILLKNISFDWFSNFKIVNNIDDIYQAYELKRFMSVGEIGYRCLLIFYGTLFPAYVLLMMIPNLSRVKMRKPWGIFAITVLISAITAYLGFVLDMGWGIAATIVVISIGRVLIELKARKLK